MTNDPYAVEGAPREYEARQLARVLAGGRSDLGDTYVMQVVRRDADGAARESTKWLTVTADDVRALFARMIEG